jgi:AbrB family looped-hinge helix DNA binding protein
LEFGHAKGGLVLKATIRERGQLTIPARMRREAQLAEGSVVELELVDDGILIRPHVLFDADSGIDAAFARSVIEHTRAGYEALRADPEAWQKELGEREELDGSLADRLDD